MNKHPDGLYKPKNRVSDNLVRISIHYYSAAQKAVKFTVTYSDLFHAKSFESWMTIADFEKQFEFIDFVDGVQKAQHERLLNNPQV